MYTATGNELLCIVAIVRDELPFLDEWLAYHRILGVDHFYLYDDDPSAALNSFLVAHQKYVTIINWHRQSVDLAGLNRQTKAYNDAIDRIGSQFEWVAFIDIDEFIVLPGYQDLPAFLRHYSAFGQISLQWYLFGHNGFFNDPPGFVTTTLTRRMAEPHLKRVKSIAKVSAIENISSAHYCKLRSGYSSIRLRQKEFADGQRTPADSFPRINHYMCRSFSRWMKRADRGAVSDDAMIRYPKADWKTSRAGCLKQFVEIIANKFNEHEDTYMLRFEEPIKKYLSEIGLKPGRAPEEKIDPFYWVKPPGRLNSAELVVYTAAIGQSDLPPLQQRDGDGVDFVVFAEAMGEVATWTVRALATYSDDSARNLKAPKILSHLYFPDNAYSLWIDPSIKLNVSALELADMFLGDFDMVVHRHPDRNCPHQEAEICCKEQMDNPEVIKAQMKRYKQEGYAERGGLHFTGIILRRHNERVRKFNELWWAEIQQGSLCDHLSSAYVAQKVGLKVAFFPGSIYADRPDYNSLFNKVVALVSE
jgi:hypothetical protein